ncbi:MAG: 50S ribosomal protein L7ae [Thaumarchaeota archaeon]|jgi:large subunit ribosomal protein L7Ae|nr:50S ribosomal protein L7ae [Nitrososphaerota archaeon]
MVRVTTADYEPSKELVEEALELLRIASKTGKVKRGTNETTKALERGVAKLAYVADNTDPVEVVLHIPLLSRDRKIPYIVVPDKKQLGEAAGLSNVSAAAVAIIDPGEAAPMLESVVKKIESARAKAGGSG